MWQAGGWDGSSRVVQQLDGKDKCGSNRKRIWNLVQPSDVCKSMQYTYELLLWQTKQQLVTRRQQWNFCRCCYITSIYIPPHTYALNSPIVIQYMVGHKWEAREIMGSHMKCHVSPSRPEWIGLKRKQTYLMSHVRHRGAETRAFTFCELMSKWWGPSCWLSVALKTDYNESVMVGICATRWLKIGLVW
jgi:hypothetical protein